MIFKDDGTPVDPASIPIPELCNSCVHKGVPEEEIVCSLVRMEVMDGGEFKCYAYRSFYGELEDDILS